MDNLCKSFNFKDFVVPFYKIAHDYQYKVDEKTSNNVLTRPTPKWDVKKKILVLCRFSPSILENCWKDLDAQ